jgi:hypothetical protein
MAQIILDSNNNLIQGDFDNATLNNRTKLQTTTTNATTNVYVVPNGSATSAGVSVSNAADPTNASKIVMATNGTTDTQIISGVNGSGSYLPMSFYVNNALAFQYGTAGQLKVGAAAAAGTSGQVLTSGGASAAPSWTTLSSGGMTLLGTLTMTSGTSQTLSGLTLTSYKYLFITFQNVSLNNNASITKEPNGILISQATGAAASSLWGTMMVDLSTGTWSSTTGNAGSSTGEVSANATAKSGNVSWSTATTSLVFGNDQGGTFDAGSIKVYGLA